MRLFEEYKLGIRKLLEYVSKDDPHYLDIVTLQGRLEENIHSAGIYGDTPALGAARSQILEQLNKITIEITVTITFHDLCSGTELRKPSPEKKKTRRGKKIFISHSTKDRDFVIKLSTDLEDAGYQVWYAGWETKVGDSVVQKIDEGLTESSHLVIVLSPNSVSSKWVQRELNSTLMEQLSRREIIILPILYRPCEIPILLRDLLYADMSTNYQAGLEQLLEALANKPSRTKSVVR